MLIIYYIIIFFLTYHFLKALPEFSGDPFSSSLTIPLTVVNFKSVDFNKLTTSTFSLCNCSCCSLRCSRSWRKVFSLSFALS
jgi:hypothetical protein